MASPSGIEDSGLLICDTVAGKTHTLWNCFYCPFWCNNNLCHICGSMWAQKFKLYSPLKDWIMNLLYNCKGCNNLCMVAVSSPITYVICVVWSEMF